MKESIGSYVPSGHEYTAEEVRCRLEKGMNDLRSNGLSGFSGYYGPGGHSGFSGSMGPIVRGIDRQIIRLGNLSHTLDKISHNNTSEGFIAKGVRELKEYFQSLFAKTPKKEIEHGK